VSNLPPKDERGEQGNAYTVSVDGSHGTQIGDHNTQINYVTQVTAASTLSWSRPITATGEIESPYRGLTPFGAHGVAFSFGRDTPAVGATPATAEPRDLRVETAAALADGRVVTGGEDGRVLVWDPAAPERGPAELGRHNNDILLYADIDGGQPPPQAVQVRVAAALADGRVVTGGADGRIAVWAPGSAPFHLGIQVGLHEGVSAIAPLADGRVATAGGYDGQVLIWQSRDRGSLPEKLGNTGFVLALAALADGRIVTGEVDGRVRVWDPAVRASIHLSPRESIQPSPRGQIPQSPRGHEASPRRLDEGRVYELGRHEDSVRAVAALADGRVVAAGDDGRVLMWNPGVPGRSPVELGRHGGKVCAVAALADGRVVTGGDGHILMWDSARPKEVAQLRCSVTALAVPLHASASSQLIVVHQGGRFSVWSVME
jgi:WD40 repeat protein